MILHAFLPIWMTLIITELQRDITVCGRPSQRHRSQRSINDVKSQPRAQMMYSGFEFLAGNKELRLSRTAKSDADSEDNTDAKGRQQFEELDVDENEFDDSLPIEHPDADEHVEPAIAARFRVCRMVKATFHKDLAFSGRTLEVDECLVTCERMDGGKKFSHIFKLIDWPCGAKLEGRCQDGGSCTAFVY